MLMSAGVELPKKLFGHGFITKEGLKMGKSLGNTLDSKALVGTYGADAVRRYFLKAVGFARDGDCSEKRLVDIVNADLAYSVGNLLNRSLNLLRENCDSTLPFSAAEIGADSADAEESEMRECAARGAADARVAYEALNFMDACEIIISVSTKSNVYIDSAAPWTAFKSGDVPQRRRAQRCIVNALEAGRVVAVGLSPVTLSLSRTVYAALGIEEEFDDLKWDCAMTLKLACCSRSLYLCFPEWNYLHQWSQSPRLSSFSYFISFYKEHNFGKIGLQE